MKRVLMGLLWFVILYVGILMVVGGVAGAVIAGQQHARNYQQGYAAGNAVGQEVGRRYGGLMLLGALALAVAGTATGVLPGTKPRRRDPLGPSGPGPSGGVWPPPPA